MILFRGVEATNQIQPVLGPSISVSKWLNQQLISLSASCSLWQSLADSFMGYGSCRSLLYSTARRCVLPGRFKWRFNIVLQHAKHTCAGPVFRDFPHDEP